MPSNIQIDRIMLKVEQEYTKILVRCGQVVLRERRDLLLWYLVVPILIGQRQFIIRIPIPDKGTIKGKIIRNLIAEPNIKKRFRTKFGIKKRQATYIAPLQPHTFAMFPSWRSLQELVV